MKLFSTKRSDVGRAVVWVWEPRYSVYPRAILTHVARSGRPVLRGSESWRSVNGFAFRLGRRVVFVTFRRFWRL